MVIPNKFNVTTQDAYNYAASKFFSDQQLCMILKVSEKLEEDSLAKAVRLTLDLEPVLGCKLIENGKSAVVCEHRDKFLQQSSRFRKFNLPGIHQPPPDFNNGNRPNYPETLDHFQLEVKNLSVEKRKVRGQINQPGNRLKQCWCRLMMSSSQTAKKRWFWIKKNGSLVVMRIMPGWLSKMQPWIPHMPD